MECIYLVTITGFRKLVLVLVICCVTCNILWELGHEYFTANYKDEHTRCVVGEVQLDGSHQFVWVYFVTNGFRFWISYLWRRDWKNLALQLGWYCQAWWENSIQVLPAYNSLRKVLMVPEETSQDYSKKGELRETDRRKLFEEGSWS